VRQWLHRYLDEKKPTLRNFANASPSPSSGTVILGPVAAMK
jgi:hypothetical protein